MQSLIELAKFIPVLIGAVILGNWFLAELKKTRRLNLPLYKAYLSPPGLMILAALLVPIVFWLAQL